MNDLILVKDGATLTTSLVIADGVDNEHKAVIQLVRKYQADLNEFGEITFEMAFNNQGKPTEFALLNEHQATLLLTYMRNTDIVREFKKRLVKAFFEMAGRLSKPQPAFAIPQTLSDALRLAADLAEQHNALERKVSELNHDNTQLQQRLNAITHILALPPQPQPTERIAKAHDTEILRQEAYRLISKAEADGLTLRELTNYSRRLKALTPEERNTLIDDLIAQRTIYRVLKTHARGRSCYRLIADKYHVPTPLH